MTTDEVLAELLNGLSKGGPALRQAGAQTIRAVFADPNIDVVPRSRMTLHAGLALYEQRRDKACSLTDCISMVTMRSRGIQEVLTHDYHFGQEGFTLLFADD